METINKDLTKKIKSWLKDFEKTQPKNVEIDDDTFEGSAYYLLSGILGITEDNEGYFPITSVSREDLEGIGFDTKKVDDGDMEQLASKLGDAYLDNGFWIDLPIIAEESLKIPKKSKK